MSDLTSKYPISFVQFIPYLMAALAVLALPLATSPVLADEQNRVQKVAEQASEQASDAWVRGKIEGAYLFNRELNPLDIKVRVDDGAVVLKGDVTSDAHKDLAREVALSIEGVNSVDDQLKVKPDMAEEDDSPGLKETISDGAVTAQIKAKLLVNSNVSGRDISVSTEQGKVTLSGTVESAAEKDLAYYIAQNTAGTRNVENQLTVQ